LWAKEKQKENCKMKIPPPVGSFLHQSARCRFMVCFIKIWFSFQLSCGLVGRKMAGKSKQLLALRLKRMGKMPVVGGKCWKQKVHGHSEFTREIATREG